MLWKFRLSNVQPMHEMLIDDVTFAEPNINRLLPPQVPRQGVSYFLPGVRISHDSIAV